jgi:putative peptidoglycan lipid II flippase
MVYDLLIGGALSAALIPVFSEYTRDDQNDDLWSLASTVMLIGGVALALMAIVLTIFARPLIWILAPGLPAETQEQAIGMVQVVLPAVIFLGLSGISTGLLQSRQSFLFPAFAVAGFNLGLIVCAVLFGGLIGTTSLAVGIVAGAIFQLALQIPGLRKIGFRFKLNLHHPALKRILVLYTPVALGLIVTQIGILVDRNLASYAGDEALAIMRFATAIIQLPVGLVAVAVSQAVLPTLSRFANEEQQSFGKSSSTSLREIEAQSDRSPFKATLVMGMRLASLVMIPAAVGLMVLRVPVVQLLFQHGAFDAQGTELTALAFLAYAPQLPFLPIDYLLIFAFYARKNTVTPVVVGVITVCIYVVVAFLLKEPLGMVGLCLANTTQNSLHAVILFFLLLRAMGSLRGFGLWSTLARIIVAAGVMGVVIVALLDPLVSLIGLATLERQVAVIAVATIVGCVVYAISISLLRIEEATTFRRLAFQRLSRTLNRPSPNPS